MSESLTGTESVSTETSGVEAPTGEDTSNTADVTQDVTVDEQSTAGASDDTAKQTETNTENETGGVVDKDLAKFAKGQGWSEEDLSNATQKELAALKLARGNVVEQRTKMSKEKVSDTSNLLAGDGLELEVRKLKYKDASNDFFNQEDIDRSLEPSMTQIIKDKFEQVKAESGEEFARQYITVFGADLPTVYKLAQLESGKLDTKTAVEQGRREERDSINRQLSASAPDSDAVQPTAGAPIVSEEWIKTTYDPKNPEHKKLVDAYFGH